MSDLTQAEKAYLKRMPTVMANHPGMTRTLHTCEVGVQYTTQYMHDLSRFRHLCPETFCVLVGLYIRAEFIRQWKTVLSVTVTPTRDDYACTRISLTWVRGVECKLVTPPAGLEHRERPQ